MNEWMNEPSFSLTGAVGPDDVIVVSMLIFLEESVAPLLAFLTCPLLEVAIELSMVELGGSKGFRRM